MVKKLASDPANVVFALVRSLSGASSLQEFVAGHEHKNVLVFEADSDNKASLKVNVEMIKLPRNL